MNYVNQTNGNFGSGTFEQSCPDPDTDEDVVALREQLQTLISAKRANAYQLAVDKRKSVLRMEIESLGQAPCR
jgi:hypothetical protein